MRLKEDIWVPAAVGLAAFTLYAVTATRTIFVGDSGELVTAVYTVGIPHPSGYPLFVLLGKLFTLLVPVGSIAFRMSLFSAFFGALSCVLVYRLCRESLVQPPAAAAAGLLLATAHSFWAEANIQRVYTLNATFVALACLFALRWYRERTPRDLLLASLTCGLGATNHTFMAVFWIALMAFFVLTERELLKAPRRLVWCGVVFGLGLLPYLYLPFRSRMNPPLDWGNPEKLSALWDVVSRKDFWNRRWIRGLEDLIPITADYLSGFVFEFTILGVLLAAIGLVAAISGRHRRWPWLLVALGMSTNLFTMASHGSRSDIFIWHRYYIPSYVLLAWLAGWGLQVLTEWLPERRRRVVWAAALLPVALAAMRYSAYDRHRFRIGEDYSHRVLEALPPGAHLIATDDNILFVLMYLRFVDGVRPDVDLIMQGVGGQELPPLRFDPDTDPLFFVDHPNWNLPELAIVPAGIVFRAWRRARPYTPPPITEWRLDGELDPGVPKEYLTQNLIGHFHYMLANALESNDWVGARKEYAEAARTSPDNDVLFFNLGLIFWGNGVVDDALAAFQRSKDINAREILNEKKPKAKDHVERLEEEKTRHDGMERDLRLDPSLAALAPGSAAYHRRLAELFTARGEELYARGHTKLALEAEAGWKPTPLPPMPGVHLRMK